jgi:hypothetical protein
MALKPRLTAITQTRSLRSVPGRAESGQDAARRVSLWASRSSRTLTNEDEREIAENAAEFFRLLAQWDAAERGESDERPASRQS